MDLKVQLNLFNLLIVALQSETSFFPNLIMETRGNQRIGIYNSRKVCDENSCHKTLFSRLSSLNGKIEEDYFAFGR